MFKNIMVPVDLVHADKLTRSLETTAEIAKLYDAPVTFVGVTSSAPGALGHNPKEFEAKLKSFAEEQSAQYGIKTDSRAVIAHDPAVDLDQALARSVDELGCDLVIMATHVPNLADHFMHSHGGQLAKHTNASVFLVRG